MTLGGSGAGAGRDTLSRERAARVGTLFAAAFLHSVAAVGQPQTFSMPSFGPVAVYAPPGQPEQVVLFISGDGGWNLGVVSMAERLRETGALVAGIDIRRLLRSLESSGDCAYPAGPLEEPSRAVQSRWKVAEYRRPILVGYSSGATLVYAALVAATTSAATTAASSRSSWTGANDRPAIAWRAGPTARHALASRPDNNVTLLQPDPGSPSVESLEHHAPAGVVQAATAPPGRPAASHDGLGVGAAVVRLDAHQAGIVSRGAARAGVARPRGSRRRRGRASAGRAAGSTD